MEDINRTATVTKNNETFNPHRRYEKHQQVQGYEADRLVELGLAEYDVVDQVASTDEATDQEQKES